jgi:EmrB/QacA subfamily drug resistance transporter
MVQLIVFRGVQGVGGGFIFANAFAIIGDLYSPAERGRYAGIMSSVFGLASVIGPLVGGWITDNLDWRWVFYVNIPLGIAAFLVLAVVLPPGPRHRAERRIDYAGAATLAAGIAPMLLAFSWAGTDYAWSSPQVIAPLCLSAGMLAAFLMIEQRAEDPIVPLSIFRNRIFAVCTAVTFVSGAAMFAGSVYIPLFMQGVLDFSATNAGLVLTPMTVAMVAASALGGQLISRTGTYRWLTIAGLAVATTGLFLLSRLDADSSQYFGMAAMSVMGFGLGLSFPALVLASQNAVPHAMMGVTTSLNQFSRSVGGTIGVAIMGSWLTRRLNAELGADLPARVQAEAPAPLLDAIGNPRVLLDPESLARLRDEGFGGVWGADGPILFDQTLRSMREALATSITEVFLIGMALMAAAFVISWFLREVPLRRTIEMPSPLEVVPSDGDGGPDRTPIPLRRAEQARRVSGDDRAGN